MYRERVLFLLVLFCIGLSLAAAVNATLPGDLAVTQWVQGFASPALDDSALVIDWLADNGPMAVGLAVATLVLIVRGHRTYALGLVLVSLLAIAIPLLKDLIGRPRPSEGLVRVLFTEHSAGYPSGHALTGAAYFGAMLWVSSKLVGPGQGAVWLFRVFLVVAILLIGASRVYAGAHWPSDVLGGFLIGGTAMAIVMTLVERTLGARSGGKKGPGKSRKSPASQARRLASSKKRG